MSQIPKHPTSCMCDPCRRKAHRLTYEQVRFFAEKSYESFGVELSFDEAEEAATRFLRVMKLVAKIEDRLNGASDDAEFKS